MAFLPKALYLGTEMSNWEDNGGWTNLLIWSLEGNDNLI